MIRWSSWRLPVDPVGMLAVIPAARLSMNNTVERGIGRRVRRSLEEVSTSARAEWGDEVAKLNHNTHLPQHDQCTTEGRFPYSISKAVYTSFAKYSLIASCCLPSVPSFRKRVPSTAKTMPFSLE